MAKKQGKARTAQSRGAAEATDGTSARCSRPRKGGVKVGEDGLTDKQRLFVQEYLVDCNATQAAIRAGYSSKTAGATGAENLKKPQIQIAIRAAMDARIERTQMTQDEVLAELAAIARCDMRDFLTFADNGEVYVDWSAMPKGATKLIREITQEVYLEGMGEDAQQVKRTKFKLHSKLDALKLLGTHMGMFAQRHKLEVQDKHVTRITLDLGEDDDE